MEIKRRGKRGFIHESLVEKRRLQLRPITTKIICAPSRNGKSVLQTSLLVELAPVIHIFHFVIGIALDGLLDEIVLDITAEQLRINIADQAIGMVICQHQVRLEAENLKHGVHKDREIFAVAAAVLNGLFRSADELLLLGIGEISVAIHDMPEDCIHFAFLRRRTLAGEAQRQGSEACIIFLNFLQIGLGPDDFNGLTDGWLPEEKIGQAAEDEDDKEERHKRFCHVNSSNFCGI